MRALVVFGTTLLIVAVTGMAIAVVGRSLDWSPYALVMLGALAGMLAGASATIALYVTDPLARSDYDLGYERGHADAAESRRARR